VPGSILDGRHAGSHALLQDGARAVESAEDVLETLREWGFGPEWRLRQTPRQAPAAAPVEPRLGRVLEHLGADPVSLDALAAACRMAPAALLAALLELELAGRVQPFPGQRYARAAAPQT
jgi:DNA processing protein